MAGEGKRRTKPAPVVTVNLSDEEARERTIWIMSNYDMCTGKYLSTPPWELREQQKASGGDGD